MTTYDLYSTHFGQIAIAVDEDAIVALGFHRAERPMQIQADWQRQPSKLGDKAARQLEEYFNGQRQTFDLPLNPDGTDFQRRVWDALLHIPYGETRSYSQQAQSLGNPKAVRAVARANGANPIAVIVPCHRIIGADGSLTGYAGGLDIKARLLTLEGASFVQQTELL